VDFCESFCLACVGAVCRQVVKAEQYGRQKFWSTVLFIQNDVQATNSYQPKTHAARQCHCFSIFCWLYVVFLAAMPLYLSTLGGCYNIDRYLYIVVVPSNNSNVLRANKIIKRM
jgi:hypothetical protein